MSKKNLLVAISIAAVLVIIVVSSISGEKQQDSLSGQTFLVQRGPLTISFTEAGTIKAREQIILKSQVEGRTSIIYLIEEGTRVKKGDLLVELDASSLETERLEEQSDVYNAEARYIGAKENLAVVENQAKSDVDLAKLNLAFAKQDLDKYINGEYPYELDKADAAIKLAQQEHVQAKDTLKYSRDLFKEQFISQTELQKDELAEQKKALDVKLAEKSKELLKEYTYTRNLAQLKSDVSQAEMALERIERKAAASVIQAQAEFKASDAEYLQQKSSLQEAEDQITKTKIYAPADGLAIYASSAQQRRWRGSDGPLDEGQEIQERQELIYLPIGNKVKVEIVIHESNLDKTRIGQPAIITVDALQSSTFYGTVAQIAPLPDAQSMWMNSDLKVYNSEIYLDGENEILRTGMGCQAQVIIQQYQDVIAVPLQAVIRVGSQPTVYVKTSNGFEPRKVQIGLDNNKLIHITEGLQEGDIILLTPPLKSASKGISDHNDLLPDQRDMQQKISSSLNDINSTNQTGTPDRQRDQQAQNRDRDSGRNRRSRQENLTPEQRQELRKQYEQMSPEEKEKLRNQRSQQENSDK